MVRHRLALLLVFACCVSAEMFAQIGGQHAFEFLRQPFHARIAALGNDNISSGKDDVNMLVSNPALMSQMSNRSLGFNYRFVSVNAHLAYVSYVDSIPLTSGKWGVGIQHLNHGTFEGYDDAGNPTVDFTAADISLGGYYAQQVSNFSFGSGIKWVYSQMAGLGQSALLLDLASSFIHPEQDLVVAATVSNLGFFTSRINTDEQASLPFDIKLGASYKPQYMPIRFSVTAYRLANWELVYYEPNLDPDLKPGTVDNIFRHMVFGSELILSKAINLRLGYNHLVRRELALDEHGLLTGFSFGGEFKTKRFVFAYARSIYHTAGGGHTFSIISNLNYFIN